MDHGRLQNLSIDTSTRPIMELALDLTKAIYPLTIYDSHNDSHHGIR